MLEYLMCMFGYLKTPNIMLSIVSSQKLDWTHTFDTHCMSINRQTDQLRQKQTNLTKQHAYKFEAK